MKKQLRKIIHRLPVVAELDRILFKLNQIIALQNVNVFDLGIVNHPRYSNPKRLIRYQFKVNSQNGEDGIINEIFNRIGNKDKVFVEIGVGNGDENNTAFLLTKGWKGYWVDGINFINNICNRSVYKDGSLQGMVTFVNRENIGEVFSKLDIPQEFDLLSLDIDQNTYYIWEALSLYKPRVVVVEYNASLPPDVDWKVGYEPLRVWDGSINYGASLKAYELLGTDMGYCLVGCDFNGVNAFFVRDDLVEDKFETPFTAENHYEPFRMLIGFNQLHSSSFLEPR